MLTTALISSLAFSDSNPKPSPYWSGGVRTKLKIKTKALLSPDVSCQLGTSNLKGFSNSSDCTTPIFLNLNINLIFYSNSYLLTQTQHLLLLPKLKIRHSKHQTVNKAISIAHIFGWFAFLGVGLLFLFVCLFFQSLPTTTIPAENLVRPNSALKLAVLFCFILKQWLLISSAHTVCLFPINIIIGFISLVPTSSKLNLSW